jgi:hypothetical protein
MKTILIDLEFTGLDNTFIQDNEIVQQPLTPLQRIAKERDIALELKKKGLTGEALRAEWEKRTGQKTIDSYYRRLK